MKDKELSNLELSLNQLKVLKNRLDCGSSIGIHVDINKICNDAVDVLLENLPKHDKSKEEVDQIVQNMA